MGKYRENKLRQNKEEKTDESTRHKYKKKYKITKKQKNKYLVHVMV